MNTGDRDRRRIERAGGWRSRRRMRGFAGAIAVLVLCQGGRASSQSPAPQKFPLHSSIVQQWRTVRGLVTRTLEKMPDGEYGFRPTPEMRTFAGSAGHLISAAVTQCGNLTASRHALTGQPLETSLATKAEVVSAWTATAEFCDGYFNGLTTNAQLSDRFYEATVTRDGQRVSIKGAHGVIVSAFLTHLNEMYGYMAVYLRLKGLVPPSSERTPPPAAAPAAVQIDATAVIARAIEAQGGEATLRGLRSLSFGAMGHQWALEQSERPDGPWLTIYQQRSEVRDLVGGRRTIRRQQRDWSFPEWSPAIDTVVTPAVAARRNGDRWLGGSPQDIQDLEALALEPERLLLTVRATADTRLLPDEVHQGVRQRMIDFSFQGRRHRLALNAWTLLPTMLEFVRDDAMWGDVTERRWYSFWTMHGGGLMYPRQTSIEWNGRPWADWTIHRLTFNPAIDDAVFQVPEDAVKGFAANATRPTGMGSQTLDESRVTPVTDWVTQVPGGFNVAFVRQPDGLVVFEATTTSAYSASVLALAEKRYPGVKVKAVVTTSDAWPHLAGIREYVARGIPIYALDLNVPILTRMIAAPRTMSPDAQARAPQAPQFRAVSQRTVIGEGDTRIELLPVRGETGERMMLAWLPGARLLYSSDLIQRGRAGSNTFFMPMMLAEVAAAAEREQLGPIERVFGMHLPPTPWADVTAAIAAARK